MTLLSTSGNLKYFIIRPFIVTALLWSLNVPSAMAGLHQPTNQPKRLGLAPHYPSFFPFTLHKPSIPTWFPCPTVSRTPYCLSVRSLLFSGAVHPHLSQDQHPHTQLLSNPQYGYCIQKLPLFQGCFRPWRLRNIPSFPCIPQAFSQAEGLEDGGDPFKMNR